MSAIVMQALLPGPDYGQRPNLSRTWLLLTITVYICELQDLKNKQNELVDFIIWYFKQAIGCILYADISW